MGQKKNYRIIEIEKKYIKEIEMEYIEETMMMAEGRDHRGWKYKNSAKVHRLSSRRLFYVVARVWYPVSRWNTHTHTNRESSF